MSRINEFLEKLFTWMYRLLVLNFLWVVFSIRGVIVGGIFPATSATYAICRQWIRGTDLPIYKTFKSYYKNDFKNANILGYIMTLITSLLVIDYMYFSSGKTYFHLYSSYLFLLLTVLQISAFIMTFAIYNNYNLTLKENVKYILLYPISNLFSVCVLGVGVFSAIYLLNFISGAFIVFLGISFPILVISFISNIDFKRIDNKVNGDVTTEYLY